MEQASLRTSRLSRNVAHDDSSPDSGLSALRSATAAYAALREELAEERQSNAALQRCAGSQFDPCVVDALLLAIDEVDAGIANSPVFMASAPRRTDPVSRRSSLR